MDVVSALGRLLVSEQLRDRLRDNAEETARFLCEDESDVLVIAAIAPEQLKRQAELLLHKRFAIRIAGWSGWDGSIQRVAGVAGLPSTGVGPPCGWMRF